MERAALLFESFNMMVEGSYEKVFAGKNPEDMMKDRDDEIRKNLMADIKEWENTPVADLEGLTPTQFIDRIDSLSGILELFTIGSKMCDYQLPEPIIKRLQEYGDSALESLIEMAADSRLIEDHDEFLTPLMAIRVLGEYQDQKAVQALINVLMNVVDENHENFEIMVEEISDSFVKIGLNCVDAIIESIENADKINSSCEYLLDALSKIGHTKKDDRIFLCLKSAFRKMDDKVIGALYLLNYGDGRAIPLLRGYAQKNRETIDTETLYQIKYAVEMLGGDMNDII